MRHLRTAHRRDDSGAAAVEAALIIPLVLLLTFGIIEFATLLRDYNAVSNLVRDASRVASTNPRVGNVSGHQGPCPPSNPTCGRIQSFAYLASEALATSGSALPKNSITDFWVYLANPKGYPTQQPDWRNDTSASFTCLPAYCVKYAWVDEQPGPPIIPGSFRYISGTWNPATINACPADPNAQAVGVYLRVATGDSPRHSSTRR